MFRAREGSVRGVAWADPSEIIRGAFGYRPGAPGAYAAPRVHKCAPTRTCANVIADTKLGQVPGTNPEPSTIIPVPPLPKGLLPPCMQSV